MPETEPLTLEEFTELIPLKGEGDNTEVDFHPRYDNFYLHFTTDGMLSPVLREKEYFQRFLREHAPLEETLRTGIMNRGKSPIIEESLKPFENDLYKSYKIMYGYGASNKDLLIVDK